MIGSVITYWIVGLNQEILLIKGLGVYGIFLLIYVLWLWHLFFIFVIIIRVNWIEIGEVISEENLKINLIVLKTTIDEVTKWLNFYFILKLNFK